MAVKHVAAGILAAVLALTAARADTPAMFKADPALTGVYGGPSPAGLKGIRFAIKTGGPIRSTPCVYDGVLYFGSTDGTFYAVDAKTGAERWRYHSGIVNSSPSAADGVVYFTGRDNNLTALSAADGTPRWTFALGNDLGKNNYWDFYTSSPVPYGANLYVGSGDGHLFAIDRASGKPVWSYDAASRIRATPAVTATAVVFATQSGHVIAVDTKTGAKRWDFATAGSSNTFAYKDNDTTSIYASPAVAHGTVVIGGRDAFVYGIDLATGKQKWRTTHDGDSWILGSAIDGNTAYISSGSAAILQAADLQTGKEKWRATVSGALFGAAAIAGDVVVVGDFTGAVHAIAKSTGKELWSFGMDDRMLGTPAIYDGVVYVASDTGMLYALDTTTTARPLPKKYVFSGGSKPFPWFQPPVADAILGYFKSKGYEQLDGPALKKMMLEERQTHARSIVVFADNNLPTELMGEKDSTGLMRQYVDAGGRVAILGINPLSYVFDDKGEITKLDNDLITAVLGIAYPPREVENGYHIATPTEDGRRWGLTETVATSRAVDPSSVDVVLTRNEFGMASSWVKRYPNDGAVIQVTIPTARMIELTPYRIAIENGL